MKIQIRVTVSSDDGAISRSVDGGLQLATGLPEVDSDIARQDFLTQSENLLRMMGETQMPALYKSVTFAQEEAAKEAAAAKAEEAEQSNAVAAARVKLSKLRQRKEQEAGQASGASEAEPEAAVGSQEDMVTCTGCGKVISHDDAHYVSIVRDGKYDHDGVLCDACYDNEMRVPHKAARDAIGPADGGDGGAQ